ncbi:MAG: hypothetical protein Q8R92_17940 [Deltaproteobacteria bacterium]|nr:hypothetical protein [Deltaproteobacteria bacterium]
MLATRVGQARLGSGAGVNIGQTVSNIGGLALQGWGAYLGYKGVKVQASAGQNIAASQAQQGRWIAAGEQATTERIFKVVAVAGAAAFGLATLAIIVSARKGRKNPRRWRGARRRR